MSKEAVGAMIDHTLLNPLASTNQIIQLCDEAVKHRFACVCINPCRVPFVVNRYKDLRVAAVVGFPLGASSTAAKVAETRFLLEECKISEIDMVISIGHLLEGEYEYVYNDIRMVVEATNQGRGLLKVIIETGAILTQEKIIDACILAVLAGCHFVKTSTGVNFPGAKEEDVRLMRHVVGNHIGVKASGGIRSLATARAMVAAGANRLGCSSGVEIMQDKTSMAKY